MMRRYYTLLLLLLSSAIVLAQKLTISTPSQAVVGSRISVKYTLNTSNYEDIKIDGNFDGFDFQYGPSRSTMNSISIVNGKTTQSSSTTFTYTLMPTKAGTFTLPAAVVTCDGEKIKSGTARIEVIAAPANSTPQQSGGGNAGRGTPNRQNGNTLHTPVQGESITSSDIYFTVTASKKHVYEQEAILLTYKLYSLVTVEQLSGDIPQLDGFHTQELELPSQQSFKLENVGGKNYGTVTWRQYLVFPQKTGKLTIPSVDFNAQILVQTAYDPYDIFSGGVQRMNRVVKAPALDIEVDALPDRPANFSGVVGRDMKVEGKLSPRQIDANDATNISVTVSGTGNLHLMRAPIVALPGDFEEYDPKRTENIRHTQSGMTGTVNFEYVTVPHHAGKYAISPVEFCYFDVDQKKYVSVSTDSLYVDVAKGKNSVSSSAAQHDVEEKTKDIRYIKKVDMQVVPKGESLFASVTQLLCYAILLVVFILVMILFRHQAKLNADVAGRRRRGASKVATKRLRVAAKMMKMADAENFFDEVMRALWGYIADKLSLPVSDLNKDNVSEALSLRGIDEETIRQFLAILETCEFARFAPGDINENMENVYNESCDLIDKIDTNIAK